MVYVRPLSSIVADAQKKLTIHDAPAGSSTTLAEGIYANTSQLGVLFAGLSDVVSTGHVCGAGQSKEVPPGPVPTQISAAKKVFIGYAGENQPIEADSIFTGGSQRAYDEFYAGMKSCGKYELVGAPADADLLFEVGS